ncbi:MAG: hypothetical protein NE334_13920 [Lentisphaeraceae bacterium]|nr:hypothetical protein [Lentisphaeraceae bacterium]
MKRGNLHLALLLLVALLFSSCTTVKMDEDTSHHCGTNNILYTDGGLIKLTDKTWVEKRARKSITYKEF